MTRWPVDYRGSSVNLSAQELVEKGRATVGKADFPDTELNTALLPMSMALGSCVRQMAFGLPH